MFNDWREKIWFLHYQRRHLGGDILAGITVAIMLVPQGLAYALLAGLPPEVGLYASIAPPLIYGLLGSSRSLSVGPVAIDSLLVAAGLSQFEVSGTEEYIALALLLALLVGSIQIFLGVIKAGDLVNFISYPVLSGFMSAAALLIAISQFKLLFGVKIPRTDYAHETLINLSQALPETNVVTLGMGLIGIGLLMYFRTKLVVHLKKLRWREGIVLSISRTAPLAVVLLGTLVVGLFRLDKSHTVEIVGEVPSGLSTITVPRLNLTDVENLLPIALTLSIVGYMESISTAKSLASKRREKVNANQELIAVGAANIGAALSGGYPVTGGLSRSTVNYNAGANSGLASIITALLVALVALIFTPLFYYLPNVVLAAIILVASSTLINFQPFIQAWRYNRADALAFGITFMAIFVTDIVYGIGIGVVTALAFHLWQTSRPHVAVLGRVGQTEHYRNVLRYETQTYPHLLAVRIDESLYFANAQYLEQVLMNTVVEHPEVKHLILVCSGINTIDISALQSLENLIVELKEFGIGFSMAEIKGPVMDKLKKIGFVERLGEDHIFLYAHEAIQALSNSK